MDTRKVLEMGGGTVLISLPKSWARRNGVVRGSSVTVDELSSRKLLVMPLEGKPKDESEVVIEFPGGDVGRAINDVTGAYLIGSNGIRIVGSSMITRDDRARLKAAVTRLVGLEIVDEDSKGMTMQFLLDPAVLDPEKIVRRMSSLIGGMLRDSAEGVGQDKALLSQVGERDDEVDRLYFLLVRAIRTATIDPEVAERYHLQPIECLDYRVLASYLESLGDAVSDFAKRAAGQRLGNEMTERLVQFIRTLEKMGDVAITSFLARKRVGPKKTHAEVAAMRSRLTELSKGMVGMKGTTTGTMVDLLSLLERVASIFVDISDLALPSYEFRPT